MAPCTTAGRKPTLRASSGRPTDPEPGSAVWTAVTSSRRAPGPPARRPLHHGRSQPRLAGELGEADRPRAGERGVDGRDLLAQVSGLLVEAPHLYLGPQVVAAREETRVFEATE